MRLFLSLILLGGIFYAQNVVAQVVSVQDVAAEKENVVPLSEEEIKEAEGDKKIYELEIKRMKRQKAVAPMMAPRVVDVQSEVPVVGEGRGVKIDRRHE